MANPSKDTVARARRDAGETLSGIADLFGVSVVFDHQPAERVSGPRL